MQKPFFASSLFLKDLQMKNYKHHEITEKIIGAAYKVHNTLGSGFLERLYKNPLTIELRGLGFNVEVEKPIAVYYHDEVVKVVGNYVADIIINGKAPLEIIAVNILSKIYEVQLMNYLKATAIEVGLLINYCRPPSIKRRKTDKK